MLFDRENFTKELFYVDFINSLMILVKQASGPRLDTIIGIAEASVHVYRHYTGLFADTTSVTRHQAGGSAKGHQHQLN